MVISCTLCLWCHYIWDSLRTPKLSHITFYMGVAFLTSSEVKSLVSFYLRPYWDSSHFTSVTKQQYKNTTCKVLVPCVMSWNKRSQKCSILTKTLFLSNSVHKCVYISVSEHFSFAKIIHLPDRCGISRSWLNIMIITQVHLVLETIKGHSKMCSFVTKHNATNVSSWGSVAIGMLTAGMSTRAVVRKCHVNFSTIRQYSTSNWSHNHRPCDHASPGPSHLASQPQTMWPRQPRTFSSGLTTTDHVTTPAQDLLI
jgi:hypothetical protein